MNKGKILVIDEDIGYLQRLDDAGVRITHYMPAKVRGFTDEDIACVVKCLDCFDGVVIGNNRGEGVSIAKIVPDEFRARTLIVWRTPDFLDMLSRPYVGLGFRHFSARGTAGTYLAEKILPSSPSKR